MRPDHSSHTNSVEAHPSNLQHLCCNLVGGRTPCATGTGGRRTPCSPIDLAGYYRRLRHRRQRSGSRRENRAGWRPAPPGPPTNEGTCDNWTIDLYERPLASGQTTYRPNQDLVEVRGALDNNWLYFWIKVYGYTPSSTEISGFFGIEADTNNDNCTDWFFESNNPSQNIRNQVGYNTWGDKALIAWFDTHTTSNVKDNVGGSNASKLLPYQTMVTGMGLKQR